jgi:hypothetical protein
VFGNLDVVKTKISANQNMKFPGKNGKRKKAINKYLIETFFGRPEEFSKNFGNAKGQKMSKGRFYYLLTQQFRQNFIQERN